MSADRHIRYKFAPAELEFRFGTSTRDSVLNEIRRQEPNRLSGMTKATHVVFVPNWLSERQGALAGDGAANPASSNSRTPLAADVRDPPDTRSADAIFHLEKSLPGARPTVDAYMSDERCRQFVQQLRLPSEPFARFRLTLRRADEREFVGYTFYLEDLGDDGANTSSDSVATPPGRLAPFAQASWLQRLHDPSYAESLLNGTGTAERIDPFVSTVKELLPDYGTSETALEPSHHLLLGADYAILPAAWFFHPSLLKATLKKSSSRNADEAVLAALLDGAPLEPLDRVSIEPEAFRRPGFLRFIETQAGASAFGDLFMRLVKPVLRGSFARSSADGSSVKQAYPFFASQVMDGAAFLVSDLRPHRPNDFSRVFIFDVSLNPFSRGRLLQMCTDIGTFRILALQELLSMRAVNDRLVRISSSLSRTIDDYYAEAHRTLKSDQESVEALRVQMNQVVDQLRSLSRVNRDTIHGVTESAARANEHVTIVDEGVANLGERSIPGHQTLREFLDRRFKRAVRDIDRAAGRYEMIRRRIDQALGVVRTVLDVREREYQISNQASSNNLRLLLTTGLGGAGFVFGASQYLKNPEGLNWLFRALPSDWAPLARAYLVPADISAVVLLGWLVFVAYFLICWLMPKRH